MAAGALSVCTVLTGMVALDTRVGSVGRSRVETDDTRARKVVVLSRGFYSDRPKNRAAFAEVSAARSAGSTPRAAARRTTVCATQAGSLRLPRWGTGAR